MNHQGHEVSRRLFAARVSFVPFVVSSPWCKYGSYQGTPSGVP